MTSLLIPDTFVENVPCPPGLPVGSSELHGIPVLRMWDDLDIMAVLAEPMMLWIFKQYDIEELTVDYKLTFVVNSGYHLEFQDATMAMVFKLAWL